MSLITVTAIEGKKVLGVAKMRWKKTTPGTHMYEEVDADGQPTRELCGSQYLQKGLFGGAKPPMTLQLVVLEN